MAEVGTTIRTERARRDWSADQLAEAAGISAATIYLIEGGNRLPSLTTLNRIAKAFGVTAASLMAPASPETPPAGKTDNGDQSLLRDQSLNPAASTTASQMSSPVSDG